MFVAGKLFQKAGEGSGGDSHNKGWYATLSDLTTAYPTAEAGDWAIVGATDTVWIWDEDTSAWVDSDQKGQVVSVNSKTGTVVLDAFDVDAVAQFETLPAASQANAGKVVQYVGATSASYTNGYFYKNIATTTASSATASQTAGSSLTDVAVVVATFETQITTSGSYVFTSDGADWSYDGNVVDLTDYGITYTGTPVADDAITVVYTAESTSYAWGQVDVQPAPSGLPDQTGQSGKFLTTDGTDASWSDKPLVNQKDLSTTSSVAFGIVGSAQIDRIGSNCVAIGSGNFISLSDNVVKIGTGGRVNGSDATYVGVNTGQTGVRTARGAVCVGKDSRVGGNSNSVGMISVGARTTTFENYSITLGYNAAALAVGAIQIGHYEDPNNPDTRTENNDANTFKVANGNGNFEIMSADGTIPADRFTTTPSADGTYYPTLSISSGIPTRSWGTINALQNAATGADSLSILGNAISSTNSIVLGKYAGKATGSATSGVYIGTGAGNIGSSLNASVFIGSNTGALTGAQSASYCIAIGSDAHTTTNNSIQLNVSGSAKTNSDTNTFKVANTNGNFEIMSADGTVPTARLTKVNTTATLAVADWSSSTQTVTVSGVKADSVVFVSPAPASASDYASAGILCTAQAADSLTFTCTTTPTSAITVNVVCM